MDPDSNLPPADMWIIVLWRGAISSLEDTLRCTNRSKLKLLICEALHIPVPAGQARALMGRAVAFILCVKSHDGATVGELKAKVCAEQSIGREHKVLRMNGFDLDDGALLWAATVMEGTKLHLIKYQN
ncbi:hypothetical protein L3X38_043900 [Prunus dulcis]|uniref:Ubiquitin-like superfamily protein n=1 Tax=Prunus dulcis TaxID=3755 RepID=A0AAD4YMY2_PRUDU|nr:hypothetical protein L3X38_043900 [Prunus dulcis]